jgi:CDP-4-dehydro-6-deoxyglucose reductase
MPLPQYTFTCTQNICIAHDIHELKFTKPAGFTFQPGQFLMLDVPSLEDETDLQPRAYSIASTPAEEEVLIGIKIKHGGRAGEWVKQQLKPGMEVAVKGPLGAFLLYKETHKDYLFVCTGAGLAPFRSIVKAALEAGETRRMDLVHGVCEEQDFFWREEFAALAERYPNFHVHYTLSKPAEGWTGSTGYVQKVSPQVVPDARQRSVYVCGNPVMTGSYKTLCLEEWGIPKEDFHMEGYI